MVQLFANTRTYTSCTVCLVSSPASSKLKGRGWTAGLLVLARRDDDDEGDMGSCPALFAEIACFPVMQQCVLAKTWTHALKVSGVLDCRELHFRAQGQGLRATLNG